MAHDVSLWTAFMRTNEARRAVRDFDGTPIDEADLLAVCEAARLAPTSGNLQPYALHCVRDGELKARVAAACNGQRAARTASALIVVAASPALALACLREQQARLAQADGKDAAHAYHAQQLAKFGRFLRFAVSPFMTLVRVALSLFDPAYALLPLGPSGVRNWAARSAVYAAQTLMLAASARGIDSCPMEGFGAREVRRLLGLPRGTVIPIVLALGRRSRTARVEPRSRRALTDLVVTHV